MPFVPAVKTAQFEMVYTWQSQICENVFHVLTTGVWDDVELDTVCDLFIDWHATNLRPIQHDSAVLQVVRGKDMEQQNALGVEVAVTTNGAGTASGNSMPTGTTVAVKWTTSLSGRSFRGRSYHIGMVDSHLNGFDRIHLSSSAQSSYRTAYAAMIALLTTVTYTPVVVSKFHNNAPRNTAVMTRILGNSVDAALDSQRRRLAGRGS